MVVLVVGWAVDRDRERRPRPSLLPGMALEGLVLGAGLIGLNRLCSLGFDMLQGGSIALQAVAGAGPAQGDLTPWLAFLGAGIYEEALFRLALLPAIYQALRLLHAPALLAATCAVTGSSLAFSLAHHAGASGEPFAWYPFFFRWLAGTYFAWVCCARGFGIAVGAHAAYDVGVGGLDAML
jgi:membrane protease YdiL (CAAX protease family)